MNVVCISTENASSHSAWLTINHEYLVLSILALPEKTILFRVMADDTRTPILAESSLFAAASQPLPDNWVVAVREGGVVELGPRDWLDTGFWERFFDREPEAEEIFRREFDFMKSENR
jgi:hypothetical protein